jgi:crotonobetainyl-CoA:carnitine CoA-transferase CaiB-like acyl-CoA transferase
MTSEPDAARPLAGTLVIDLTTFLSGPLTTRALADLGADVVKVEPPAGDPTRAGWTTGPEDPSPFWTSLHRGRRSVVLDLTTDAGRGVLHLLAARADVLVENYRPGVAERLGIGPDALRAAHPHLVTCSISGFGPDGPMAGIPAIDGPVQAFTGTLALTERITGVALPMPVQVADVAGGVAAAQGILAALLARTRTGRGTHVEVSLAEALLGWLSVTDRIGSMDPPATVVVTGSDGLPFLVQTTMHLQARLLELIASTPGFADAAADPRWSTMASRRAARDDYEALLREVAATAPRDEWLARLWHAGVPAGPVQSLDEALDHPQLAARQAVGTMELGGGTVPVVAPPWRFDGRRAPVGAPPPRLGADTAGVLHDVLGLDDTDVAGLSADGAFGPPR